MSLAAIEYDARSGPSLAASLARAPAPRTMLIGRERAAEFQSLLLRLDRDSRCRRFGHAASDDALRTHADTALRTAFGVIAIAADGRLRGAIEMYSCAPQPFCEAALVVEPQWRRQGLGLALLRAAARFADEASAVPLRLIFTRDNWPMRKLAAKVGARFDLVLDELCAEVAPARCGMA
jgi:GNAT superfamily N-acetyltransferase